MKVFRYVTTITILAGLFFMLAVPPTIYAQASGDINKNPTIIMDKQVIEIDRRVLKSAQGAGDRVAIKAAQKKLQQDIRKMKADKAVLKKSRQKRK